MVMAMSIRRYDLLVTVRCFFFFRFFLSFLIPFIYELFLHVFYVLVSGWRTLMYTTVMTLSISNS
jgi:hypothetical protein